MRKNKNRGYQKLRVWMEAVEYYRQTCSVFRKFPYNLKRVVSQAIAYRNHLKKVFSSDIGVESSSQVLDILEYASGLILSLALTSNENPNFEMVSIDSVHRNISEGYCRRSIHEYLRFLYPNVGKVEDTPYTRGQGRSRSNLLQVLDNAVDGVLSAFLKGKQNNLKIMSIGYL
jgi:hypothetical protein